MLFDSFIIIGGVPGLTVDMTDNPSTSLLLVLLNTSNQYKLSSYNSLYNIHCAYVPVI